MARLGDSLVEIVGSILWLFTVFYPFSHNNVEKLKIATDKDRKTNQNYVLLQKLASLHTKSN